MRPRGFRIAIALERFRLARGEFPASLEQLFPEFLPEPLLDPWSGAPMKYRRTPSGRFLLYSVGKDAADDGGVINPKPSEREQRDAVWLYAPP